MWLINVNCFNMQYVILPNIPRTLAGIYLIGHNAQFCLYVCFFFNARCVSFSLWNDSFSQLKEINLPAEPNIKTEENFVYHL